MVFCLFFSLSFLYFCGQHTGLPFSFPFQSSFNETFTLHLSRMQKKEWLEGVCLRVCVCVWRGGGKVGRKRGSSFADQPTFLRAVWVVKLLVSSPNFSVTSRQTRSANALVCSPVSSPCTGIMPENNAQCVTQLRTTRKTERTTW